MAFTLYTPTNKLINHHHNASEEFFFSPYISVCITLSSISGRHRPNCQGKKFYLFRVELRKDEERQNGNSRVGHHKQRFLCVGKVEGNAGHVTVRIPQSLQQAYRSPVSFQPQVCRQLSLGCLGTVSVHSAKPQTCWTCWTPEQG